MIPVQSPFYEWDFSGIVWKLSSAGISHKSYKFERESGLDWTSLTSKWGNVPGIDFASKSILIIQNPPDVECLTDWWTCLEPSLRLNLRSCLRNMQGLTLQQYRKSVNTTSSQSAWKRSLEVLSPFLQSHTTKSHHHRKGQCRHWYKNMSEYGDLTINQSHEKAALTQI